MTRIRGIRRRAVVGRRIPGVVRRAAPAARAAGWIVWVDHYGPEVRHIVRGRYKIVGPAPPDYLRQLRAGAC